MIKQLRPFYDPDELTKIYDHVYDHTRWEDHKKRVADTVTIAVDFIRSQTQPLIFELADLSCGDGAIVDGIRRELTDYEFNCELSDIVPADHLTMYGPIEEATRLFGDGAFDLVICSETIEHVEGPVALLRELRRVAKAMVLTTPADEVDDGNPEHYWSWGVGDVAGLLDMTGWRTCQFTVKNYGYYDHQIWVCQ